MRATSKSGARTAALALGLLCVGGVAAALLFMEQGYQQGQEAYDRVADAVFQEPVRADGDPATAEASLPDLPSVNWQALLAENPDTVGWIYVPETKIDYPVVLSHDNDEYLYRNFSGEYANGLQPTYGTPFLLAQNTADFSDAINIIQAHNMSNGSMFADIPGAVLADQESFDRHRVAYLLTPTYNYLLLSVAGFTCGAHDPIVRIDVQMQEEMAVFLQELVQKSEFEAKNPMPALEDVQKVIMLSTCTSDGTGLRLVAAYAVVAWEPAGQGAREAWEPAGQDVPTADDE